LYAGITYAETADPVGDFVGLFTGDMIDNEKLMMFQVDLNGDGTSEAFLSREKDINGRAGNIWVVYISQGDKFLRSDRLISLDCDGLIMLQSNGTGQNRLFSVTSPQKGELDIWEWLASETFIVSKKIAKIALFEGDGAETDAVMDLLKGRNRCVLPLIKGKAQDLKKSMEARVQAPAIDKRRGWKNDE